MIARAIGKQILPEILRDLKKYTAKAIIQQIEDEPESRKEWLLARFKYNGKYLKRIENYKSQLARVCDACSITARF
jgi:hypothetical protein